MDTRTGEIASWWDKLTDADLEKVTGKKDALVALVQEKYQYTRERAQQEVDRRLQEYSDKLGASGSSRVIETVQETARNVASSLAETAGEVKAQAETVASTAATAVSDTVAGAASSIRETSV